MTVSPRDVYEKVLVEEMQHDVKEEISSQPKEEVKHIQKEVEQKTDQTETKNPSILIVEDDPDTLTLIELHLKNAGYEITSAVDGIDALMLLGKNTFDLILSDINMPNLDGFKLLEMVHQKGIPSPVIFLSAISTEEAELKGLEMGVEDFIKKPFKKEVLLLRINNILKAQKK
ncbi:MAG: response regulator [Candidatus Ancaeobacter aquaticus]|nr:response regulator [Candidatus Ancaeobacter aquaticus]